MGPGGHGDLNELQPSGDQHSLLPHLSYARLRGGGGTWAPHSQEPKATSPGQAASPAHGRLPKGQQGCGQEPPAAAPTWEGAPRLSEDTPQAAASLESSACGGHSTPFRWWLLILTA